MEIILYSLLLRVKSKHLTGQEIARYVGCFLSKISSPQLVKPKTGDLLHEKVLINIVYGLTQF